MFVSTYFLMILSLLEKYKARLAFWSQEEDKRLGPVFLVRGLREARLEQIICKLDQFTCRQVTYRQVMRLVECSLKQLIFINPQHYNK